MTKGIEITIYDVARKARVSISTVSNVLNRPEKVAPTTRETVLAAVDALGYVPKADAVSKARHSMRRVGVIAPFTSYSSYLERLAGVLAKAQGAHIDVSVFDHESAAAAVAPFLAAMPIRGQVDGIIVMGVRLDTAVERRLRERNVPTVVVDAESDTFPAVLCDDRASGELAAAHLYHRGHRHFGYVVERQTSPYESQALRRLEGFKAKLTELGGCTVQVAEATSSPGHSKLAAVALLEPTPRPTAIMAHSDELAIGVLHAATELGLLVPHDVAIMGCDDLPVAQAVGLSTIKQPFRESGVLALDLLVQAIGGADVSRSVTYLPIELVPRSSTHTRSPAAVPGQNYPQDQPRSAFVEVLDKQPTSLLSSQ